VPSDNAGGGVLPATPAAPKINNGPTAPNPIATRMLVSVHRALVFIVWDFFRSS
jgi:hypothetical protein